MASGLYQATLALVLVCVPAMAQHGSTTAVNHYTGPEHALAGAKLYRAQCASCHGLHGNGAGAGPSLTTGAFRHGGSDEALFRTISKGISGTAMPPFPFSGLNIWQLVTHIRQLGIVGGATGVKGDAQTGAAIFKANCSGCHVVGAEGGLLGPELTGVGSRRSYVELRQAITDPDASVPSQYWSAVVNTNSGQTIRGIRLNEDTHSLQLRDERGQLLSLMKRDIKDMEVVRQSPMPKVASRLSEREMVDLVAFLVNLKGAN